LPPPLKNFITKRTSNTFSSATAKTLEQTLKEIQTRVDEVKIQKDELLRPFTVLSDTERFFNTKAYKLPKR
jgi:hypothetical protein